MLDCYHTVNDTGVTCIFTEILRNIDTGIIILDLDTSSIFFKNSHADRILENKESEYNDFNKIYHLLRREIEKLRQPGVTRCSRTKKYSDHRVLGYSIYRPPDDQRFVFIFIRDITDKNRLESIDEAAEIMNNIGYLFSAIRHEIGNPLNSMKMALTVLENNIHRYSKEEIATYFKRIFGEVAKMEALLISFKNFSMFERPQTQEVDLQLFFDNLFQLLGPDIRKKGVRVSVDLPGSVRKVMADPRALQHVLMNILANAMDALAGRDNPTLIIKSYLYNSLLRLTITDNGCGMVPELLRDAFKPFYTTKPHGTGLGLVISKKLMAQMDSSIEVTSESGQGATVILTMPIPGNGGSREAGN
ncbi:MAG: hypothetical protein A2511_11570 [Deltaproteobacteria bacterium RIFOXYD12_FULL_50_9]|nr:MAG: hypothetical protein A2511_11570 [Deltaproteobacteria bacterium RIFOXYD12_FULL_50_9]